LETQQTPDRPKGYPFHRKVLGILMFLPNVMPFKALITAEIFPWALFFTLRKNLSFNRTYAIFLIYLIVSAVLVSQGISNLAPMFRALFALINASLIFFLMIKLSEHEFKWVNRLFLIVFWTNVVVSLLQFSGLFPPFLVPIVQLFIDRFDGVSLGGGRGVTAIFAEPSYASIAMHYFFAYFLLTKQIDHSSKKGVFAILAMIFFDLFIIRSVTGSVMIVVYLLSLLRRDTVVKAVLGVVLVGGGLLFTLKKLDNLPRSIEVVYGFMANQEYKDPMPVLLEQSGFRLISIWSAYRYGLVNPFGSGIGGWPNASITAMEQIGVPASNISFFATLSGTEFFGVRPTSFGAGLMLEAGWVGLLIFLLAIWPYLFRKELFRNLHTRSTASMFLFNLFILGTIGDPVPFIIMGLTIRTLYPPKTELVDAQNAGAA
jgi:hypothetical protein